MTFEELGRKVTQVKPRFSEATILRNINEMARDKIIVISTHILEEVDAFTGGAHPFDDRTLVVLKVK